MKKLILIIALCLITTIAQAGQQEDINLCKERIKNKFNKNVGSGFNIGEECDYVFLVFEGWKDYYCRIDRKRNSIIVGELPYDVEIKKYSGFECLVPLNSIMKDAFGAPESFAIDKNQYKKELLEEERKEKARKDEENKKIIANCKQKISDTEHYLAYEKPKSLYDRHDNINGWIIGEITEHDYLWLFPQSAEYVVCVRNKYNNHMISPLTITSKENIDKTLVEGTYYNFGSDEYKLKK